MSNGVEAYDWRFQAQNARRQARIRRVRFRRRMTRVCLLAGLAIAAVILCLIVDTRCSATGAKVAASSYREPETTVEEPTAELPEEDADTRGDLHAAYPDVDSETILALAEQAEAYGLDVWLVMAVAEQESSFRADAISAGGDYGLMQINTINHDWLEAELGIDDWLDASQNAKAGCYLLATYLGKGYTVTQALMAYNMGENGARRAWESGKTESSYTQGVQQKIKKQDIAALL